MSALKDKYYLNLKDKYVHKQYIKYQVQFFRSRAIKSEIYIYFFVSQLIINKIYEVYQPRLCPHTNS